MTHSEQKRIVVAGAGFGGLTAALILAREATVTGQGYEIVLVDRAPRHLYTAGLYEVAAIPRIIAKDAYLMSALEIPIADIIRGRPIRFLRASIAGLDAARRRIRMDNNGSLAYEFLILALGAETNYFDIPGLKQYSIPLKTAEDAVLLRNTIERAAGRSPSLTIVIGGAGATGVELSAELINFLCVLERKKNPNAPVCRTTVMLLEASPHILPGCGAGVGRRIARRLHNLGVIVKTDAPIIAASKSDLTLKSGERVPYDVLVWTGGIKGPDILKSLRLPLSPKGTIAVDRTLRVVGSKERIFAIGDNAWFLYQHGKKPLPATAQVAVREARHVAYTISRALRGKPARRFRPLKKYPLVLAVGRKYAFADFASWRCAGLAGWCIKQLIQLRYFLFILPWTRAFALWWKSMRLYHSND